MVQQTLNGAATTPRQRNGYSGEEKLHVIKWYGENGKNLYQTCKHFALNSKTLIRWLADIKVPNVFADMMPTNPLWCMCSSRSSWLSAIQCRFEDSR